MFNKKMKNVTMNKVCDVCGKQCKVLFRGSHNLYNEDCTDKMCAKEIGLCGKCVDLDLELANRKTSQESIITKLEKEHKADIGKFHKLFGSLYIKL